MKMRALLIGIAVVTGCVSVIGSSIVLGITALLASVAAVRHRGILALLPIVVLFGCAPTLATQPALRNLAPQPLGFTGRLDGDRHGAIPATLAGALDPTSKIVFAYDE